MTAIAITELGPGRFGVEIEEGAERTGHVLTVPDRLVDELALVDEAPMEIVRETVGFLLDREPATAIGEEVSLGEVLDRYPDYPDELRTRLSGETPRGE